MSLKGMDFAGMNEACKVLFEYTDFTSFSKLHTDVKTNCCRIERAGWEREGETWVFTIRADRFLRNMVRAIVGTLFEVGRGKRSTDDFRRLIEAKNRCLAGSSVPGKGLSLVDVAYPDAIFESLNF
jgi:tRNA pseudouridine38-40 synthase